MTDSDQADYEVREREDVTDYMAQYPDFGEMRSYTDALGALPDPLGPDPAGYISDYNTAMKQRIRDVYGVDVDEALLNITP